MRHGFTTSILKVKWKVLSGNLSLSISQKALYCSVGARIYGDCIMGCWGKCIDWQFEHCSTITGTQSNLIGKFCTTLKEKRHTLSQVLAAIWNAGFQVPTALSPTAFTRFHHEWLLFVSYTEGIYEKMQIWWMQWVTEQLELGIRHFRWQPVLEMTCEQEHCRGETATFLISSLSVPSELFLIKITTTLREITCHMR